jgi:hypothetical protein
MSHAVIWGSFLRTTVSVPIVIGEAIIGGFILDGKEEV